MTPLKGLKDEVSRSWLTGRDRFLTAATAGVVVALYSAVVPSSEAAIPERSPEDFDSDHND